MKHFALLAVMLFGCDSSDVQIDIECGVSIDNREIVRDCLIDCTRAGNPFSDEEGEDLVFQCQQSCTAIYCEPSYKYFKRGSWWKCRRGLEQRYATACMQAGWKP